MTYQVFARKYRPQTFDDLVGQNHVSQTLKNAVAQNRLAHAYLFVGPRGTGKTSTARILAKSLNCLKADRPTTTPCNECANCVEIAGGNSMDVLEIDGASNNKVDEIRVLTDNVRYAPANARFKIYIIDEVHMLTPGAFNALLKTLEEPPAHVKFIFATTEPQKVLPTIVSRCQRFDLHRIATNLIADHLQFIAKKEKITLEPAAAHSIARGAEGGLRDAESMLDQLVAFCGDSIAEADVLKVFGFTSHELVSTFTDHILKSATADAVQLLHEQCEAGKDMMRLIADLIGYFRDLLVFKVKPDALSDDVDPELQKALARQSELITTDRLLELIDQFAEAEGRMKWAPNKKLHFEVAVIKAIQTLSQVTLSEVIENLNALRDGKVVAAKTPSLPAGASPAPRRAAAETAAPTTRATAAAPKATVAGVADPGNAVPAQTAVSNRGSSKAEPARVEEEAKAPSANIDPVEVWRQVCANLPAGRGFLRTLVDSLGVVGTEGRSFVVGYPPGEKSSIETLVTTNNRKQLESLLKDASGRDWTLKLVPKEGMTKPKKQAEDFQDDPLVQQALQMFKGEIKKT